MNLQNYSIKRKLTNIYCNYKNSLLQLSNRKIAVISCYPIQQLLIINTSTFQQETILENDQLLRKIDEGGEKVVFSIFEYNKNTLFIGNPQGELLVFKLHPLIFKEKIQLHSSYIRGIIKIKNNQFASYSNDKTIKIINYY